MTKKLIKVLKSQTFARGVIALLGFIVIWEFLSKYVPLLTGITLPWIGHVPPPTEVVLTKRCPLELMRSFSVLLILNTCCAALITKFLYAANPVVPELIAFSEEVLFKNK